MVRWIKEKRYNLFSALLRINARLKRIAGKPLRKLFTYFSGPANDPSGHP